ncbi:hypothetical protein DI272_38840 [Streptomyces sp. Act143]|uniref:hypothetical protein n=1 Tax=Streptomyces sp. Act143 TaxID=2200760 RepID=UPI000D67B368|nr:hypothetical protein [Streptomyces sp. Act143]PWI19453.1 hypothetical protein DI272_38840 [Streptomyces sp. Act143]
MHTYDVPRRPSFQPIPSSRSAPDPLGGPSATPIYDALYAEYVKSFRTLPGDRSGEDGLDFTAFGVLGNLPQGADSYGGHRPGSFSSSYSAYSAGAHSARVGQQQSQWQRVGQVGQHGTMVQHVPALPPGQRRGF